MGYILCFVGLIFFIIACIMIGFSGNMSKMPPKSNEQIGGIPYGAKFKDDCNDEDSWVG